MAEAPSGVRPERTLCRFCIALCRLVATVDGERVIRIEGDRDDLLSAGYSCETGRALAVLINPADAAARGLADGSLVSIRTRAGSLTATLKLSPEMMAGVVSLPHDWPETTWPHGTLSAQA